jgi:hypothetical protein
MSTGGAPTKAIIKQVVAASKVGIIRIPNQPTYRRLFVEVTQEQNCSQLVVFPLREVIAVMSMYVMTVGADYPALIYLIHNLLPTAIRLQGLSDQTSKPQGEPCIHKAHTHGPFCI